MEQKTALAAEAKSVLDSWVRYEGQVKQRQQKELAESIIGKITKELENPKTLQQILNQSVADVESKRCFVDYHHKSADRCSRDRFVKGAIDFPALVQIIDMSSVEFHFCPITTSSMTTLVASSAGVSSPTDSIKQQPDNSRSSILIIAWL